MANTVLKQPVLTKLPPGLPVSGRLPKQPRGSRGVTELRRDTCRRPPNAAGPFGNDAGNTLRCFGFEKLHKRQFVRHLLLPGTETSRDFHWRHLVVALPQFPPPEQGGNKLIHLWLQLLLFLHLGTLSPRLGTKACGSKPGSGACARAVAASFPVQDTNPARPLHPNNSPAAGNRAQTLSRVFFCLG